MIYQTSLSSWRVEGGSGFETIPAQWSANPYEEVTTRAIYNSGNWRATTKALRTSVRESLQGHRLVHYYISHLKITTDKFNLVDN